MKKLLLLPIAFMMMACQSQVPAGHVGVKVYLVGSSKGVDHEVLGVGRYYIGYNEQLYLFPTFQQNYVWTASEHEGKDSTYESIEFGAQGGVDVHANVGVAFHINKDKVADVFQTYREGVNEIRDIPLRNAVRDAFQKEGGKYDVEHLYTDKAKLVNDVTTDVKAKFDNLGIVVDTISLVGNFKLPEAVTKSLNAKIQATQDAERIENEVAGARHAKDKAIIEAEAIAQANSKKAASLTPMLVEWERIQKWDGHLPQVQGGGTPFISLNK